MADCIFWARNEQDCEIGTPARQLLKAEEKDGNIEIFVGEKSIMAQGEFV
jgi:hypothetical protein